MTINIAKIDASAADGSLVCPVAHQSPVGAHVALWYQANSQGERRFLHQAWHYDTRDESPVEFSEGIDGNLVRVLPTLDEDEQRALRAMCVRVASYIRDHKLPYALCSRDASVAMDGSVHLGASLGLTCATFLLLVIERAQIQLLDRASWEVILDPVRLAVDRAAQEKIVDVLYQAAHWRRSKEIERHADAVKKEKNAGVARIRAEEVAAAFGLVERPASYAATNPEGSAVLAAVCR